jgi:hypothetical protein
MSDPKFELDQYTPDTQEVEGRYVRAGAWVVFMPDRGGDTNE